MTPDWYSLHYYLYGSGLIRYGVSSTPLSWAEICEASYPVRVAGRCEPSSELLLLVSFRNDVLHINVLCSTLRCWWDHSPSSTGIAFGQSSIASISTPCPRIWSLWAVGSCWQIPRPLCCQFAMIPVCLSVGWIGATYWSPVVARYIPTSCTSARSPYCPDHPYSVVQSSAVSLHSLIMFSTWYQMGLSWILVSVMARMRVKVEVSRSWYDVTVMMLVVMRSGGAGWCLIWHHFSGDYAVSKA